MDHQKSQYLVRCLHQSLVASVTYESNWKENSRHPKYIILNYHWKTQECSISNLSHFQKTKERIIWRLTFSKISSCKVSSFGQCCNQVLCACMEVVKKLGFTETKIINFNWKDYHPQTERLRHC